MFRCFSVSFLALAFAAAFGQAAPPVAQVGLFHVQGTIEDMTNGTVPRVEVSFQNEHFSKTVVVDDSGFYQVDLPLGSYNMIAALPPVGPQQRFSPLTEYRRFFRVTSPMTLNVNGYLYGKYSCDGVVA